MTIATRIAEWLTLTDLDAVPEAIQARARLCSLDTVGVALAGLEAPSAHAAARAFASEGGYGFWGQPGSADLAGGAVQRAVDRGPGPDLRRRRPARDAGSPSR